MKLTESQLRKIINEEIRNLFEFVNQEVEVNTVWIPKKESVGKIPGINRGDETQATLVVYKIEDGLAYYAIYHSDTPQIRWNDKLHPNAQTALKNSAISAEELLEKSGGWRGESINLPVDELLELAKAPGWSYRR